MKTDRMLGIVNHLLSHRTATAGQLAQRFEVSRRTILRDIDALCRAGVPVIAMQGPGGGYSLSERFTIDRQLLGQDDLDHIATALGAYQSAFVGKADATVDKLAALHPAQSAPVSMDLGVLREGRDTPALLAGIERAIREQQALEIEYTNAAGQESARTVEPLHLAYKWYAWYLLAYCQKREDYRAFKLARIRKAEPAGPFTQQHEPPEVLMERCFMANTRKHWQVLLRCKASVRAQVMEYLNGELIQELPDGDFLYETGLTENERMAFSLLLGFGDGVLVLEPPEVAGHLLKVAQEICEQYKDGDK